MSTRVPLKNPYLSEIKSDFLYHLGFKSTDDLKSKFGDVRVVCMGGTQNRMKQVAKILKDVLGMESDLRDHCEDFHRYALYKVGPVICVSHGIGMPSMSVMLHEISKLVHYAECVDPVFIRIGSSGGLGVDVGTVIITEKAYNGYLQNEHIIPILGRAVHRPSNFPRSICESILAGANQPQDDFKTIIGNTMATDDFYEGQARTDGAIATHGEEEKIKFLQRCYNEFGVRNIEMEAAMFASFTSHVGIKAADVCVTFVNRINGDQVTQATVPLNVLEQRPIIVVGRYIKKLLNQ